MSRFRKAIGPPTDSNGAGPTGQIPGLTVSVAEVIEAIAQRAAEIIAEREGESSPAQDGWLRGAEKIADYIGSRRSRVYALVSARRIPVERDGSNLLAKKSELDAWIRAGGGVRP